MFSINSLLIINYYTLYLLHHYLFSFAFVNDLFLAYQYNRRLAV
ncbi:hypothetical protein VCRA2119O44_80007 [Vibrio crassostreae]|nr:hypothetical protein VCRA2110O135_280017 [Vibrio crassostreae]CAK2146588.1 hypothetical protein VCRA2119O145_40200 [Vibrio crassostreae]CAK2195120.1 hypothetical protein VCRA2118O41_60007 [Vibrio crassostreae]CAK2244400.1 hypothetical protein VCRA2119O44_80007 [Vibrio crassostreae]CAK2260474.1 hypothetical protein VCRA2117O40_90007 [Vibrio crassostreae]